MYILSDIRNPVFFTIGQSVESCIRQCTGSIALAGTRKQATCRSRLQVTGATPLRPFRFLPECSGWRLRCMRCATGAVGWSSEPQIRRGRPSFFACMQATKHCQSSICPSKIWRRGQASCDEPVQFRSRREDPLQIALFGILNVRRHSPVLDAMLTKLPGKGGEQKNHALASGISATTVEIWLPTEPPGWPVSNASQPAQPVTGSEGDGPGELDGGRTGWAAPCGQSRGYTHPQGLRGAEDPANRFQRWEEEPQRPDSQSCTHLWSPVPPLAGSAAGGHSWVVMGWKEKTVGRIGGNAPMLGGGPR